MPQELTLPTQATPAGQHPAVAPPGVPGSQTGDAVLFDPAQSGPLTAEEAAILRARRSELSDQLISAANRREELAEELKSADPGARAGLEQRIAVLDQRIIQMEQDIAETGRELTSRGELTASVVTPIGEFGLGPGQVTAISIVFIIFVLMPLAIALARLMWRRATAPRPSLGDAGPRLEQIEHAVDSIAIEVERISEGQRFVTRLLTEPNQLEQLQAPRDRAPVSVSASDKPNS